MGSGTAADYDHHPDANSILESPLFIRSDDDEAMDIWARIYIDKMDPTQLNVSEG
ncbi:unnamed protein product [Fusarium graminearum]|uniref:Chromosome 4, complete genome n=1 Tax=Gibberella zeae (strain ATCC MYA-4620 / CBS 123657 / FGSC 9075 / NRRL 31084 / PH-1) TaxID=229533 RepID=A0A098DQB3_GIBZE|nr:unnamed protein product [Fusarium graminearum]